MNSAAQNRSFLVTGCQRSGTTLTLLILDSHPDVNGIDETEFRGEDLRTYLFGPTNAPAVCFKLPGIANLPAQIPLLGHPKIIWCQRQPYDVITSMMGLIMGRSGERKLAWAHIFALREVTTLFDNIRIRKDAVAPLKQEFGPLLAKSPPELTDTDALTLAALCWRLKMEVLHDVKALQLPLHHLQYEDLVQDPKTQVADLARFLGLPWHDNLLAHEELHEGMMVGDTDSQRKIDANSVDRWREHLTEDQRAVIDPIIQPITNSLPSRTKAPTA